MTGASILMLAPRRIGKTWLLKQIAADMAAEGWLCILVDVEGMQSETVFLRALCHEIEKTQGLSSRILSHFKQRYRQLSTDAGPAGLAQAVGTIDPRDFAETLIEALNDQARKTLILIDEIALFVLALARQDADGTKSLLYHLRKLQQKYPNVSWFLTGSVGLDVVARRHGMLGAMLGYDTFTLDPFTPEAARSYIADLGTQRVVSAPLEFAAGAFEALTHDLGWLSPYYLRQIALQIRPTGASSPNTGRLLTTVDDIAKAFDKLLSPPFRSHFAAWEEHIDKNFEDLDKRRLKALLAIASETKDGALLETFLSRLQPADAALGQRAVKDLLTCLANDGYLTKAGDRWKFQSGLLRRYWQDYVVE